MLDIRPSCECCDADLPPESPLARICSFECTFCATCAERHLNGVCPNCGGELLPRPRRPASRAEDLLVLRVAATDISLLEPLGDLLIDAVHSGASVGFLAPVPREAANRYWHGVFASLSDDLLLWVAEKEGVVVGTVQLSLCDKDNGRHRAEVQKLLVLRAARGNGVATLLMGELEVEAKRRGRSLLFLDTLLASHAEDVYRHLGWTRAGEIPDYATTPDGELLPTVLYFKQLRA